MIFEFSQKKKYIFRHMIFRRKRLHELNNHRSLTGDHGHSKRHTLSRITHSSIVIEIHLYIAHSALE
jgi:hypothetical protein